MSETLTTEKGIHISPEGGFLAPETATDVVALLECSDYYLAHPSMKPKTDIQVYVESQGFLVPRRYRNLEEALTSGKDFIMRSEHPQDYDGVSGLFESYVFHASMREVTQDEVLNEQKEILSLERVQEYCKENNLDYEDFISQASFEYQEYIEGENLTVVRDEVAEGRYHIFINDKSGSDYICYDSGNIIQGSIHDNIGVGNIEKLIDQYEKISQLPRFDDLQCPNIEFQLGDDGNIYFLQYKRGHQKQLQNWTLSRELEEGEIEAQFVRGATKKGGEVFEILHREGFTYDSTSMMQKFNCDSAVPESYLKNEVVIQYDSLDTIFLQQHGFVSHICQTQLCVSLHPKMKSDILNEVAIELWLEANRGKIPHIGIRMNIMSDGQKAYIKVLDTPEDLFFRAIGEGYKDEEYLRSLLAEYKLDI